MEIWWLILCDNLIVHEVPKLNTISECTCKGVFRLAFELVDSVKSISLPSVGRWGLNRTKGKERKNFAFPLSSSLLEPHFIFSHPQTVIYTTFSHGSYVLGPRLSYTTGSPVSPVCKGQIMNFLAFIMMRQFLIINMLIYFFISIFVFHWFCFPKEPQLKQILVLIAVLEEQNFKDGFFWISSGVARIGFLIWLGLKMLMTLFPLVEGALIVHGMNSLWRNVKFLHWTILTIYKKQEARWLCTWYFFTFL